MAPAALACLALARTALPCPEADLQPSSNAGTSSSDSLSTRRAMHLICWCGLPFYPVPDYGRFWCSAAVVSELVERRRAQTTACTLKQESQARNTTPRPNCITMLATPSTAMHRAARITTPSTLSSRPRFHSTVTGAVHRPHRPNQRIQAWTALLLAPARLCTSGALAIVQECCSSMQPHPLTHLESLTLDCTGLHNA